MLFLRKEAEDDKEEEEAACPSSVCVDGGCRRFSEFQGVPHFRTEACQREETAACAFPSLQLETFTGVLMQTDKHV